MANDTTNLNEKQRATLDLQEVAKRLGISRGTAYAAAARGELPTIRIGKRILVPRAALDSLLGESRKEQTQ